MSSLQTLENKAAKIILNEHPRYFATEALQRLKWTSLETRRRNHRCTLIYQCMNGLIDFDFDLTTNRNIHGHYTRKRNDLHLPRAKTNKGKQRPTYPLTYSIDFNNLEPGLKNANSLSTFKSLLKRRIHYIAYRNFLMYIFSLFSLFISSFLDLISLCVQFLYLNFRIELKVIVGCK